MIAVALDGFLRSDKGVPIDYALKMYEPLSKTFPTAILADGDVGRAEQWLTLRGLTKHVRLHGDEVRPRSDESLRQAQIMKLRSLGPVELVIDPSPTIIAWVLQTGGAALLHANPQYMRPEFRPDGRAIRPWSEILDELDKQAEMIAADTRLVNGGQSLRWE